MTTLLVLVAAIAVVLAVATVVFRVRWQLDSFKDVWVEFAARNFSRPRSAKKLRQAFVDTIAAQQHTSLSGEPSALPAMIVRIAPEDALRLHPTGDVAALGREATDLYLQHAQSCGWRIDGLPQVRVQTDGRLRPGWIPTPKASGPDVSDLLAGSQGSGGAGPGGQGFGGQGFGGQGVAGAAPAGFGAAGSGSRRDESRRPARSPSPRPASGPVSADDQATSVIPSLAPPPPDATMQIAPVAPAKPDLVIEYAGTSYEIHGHVLGLGRKPNDHFGLTEATASFKHALLERRDSGWTVRDLGSTNGSLLDGRPLGPEPVPLPPTAELNLGGAQLTVRIP